ncbi:methylase [Cryptosporidium canis]|uniref:Trimethylguanosine synthase n=1 Tax=Cryptosporidium canis TaxID=195482 RepID=A0ABQ8PBE1_9CRYT|nr:methylase [Cryptosporidium canis]
MAEICQKTGKRARVYSDILAEDLVFLEGTCEEIVETNLKSSCTGNELMVIKGKVSSWLKLVSNSSFFLVDIDEGIRHLDNIELLRGIIINRRVTNLPIRYSNMPGSIIPNICANSLYSISEMFPCTPLNSDFEKESGEKVSFEKEMSLDGNSKLEQVLFGVLDSSVRPTNSSDLLMNRKRKREIKVNVDYLKQELSIFPGDVGREYLVFQKYDEGIILDGDAIMDATPEILSQHIARRLRGCTVLDACGGVGSNTIAFSQHCKRVISVEVSSSRTLICKHNSQVYKLYGEHSSSDGDSISDDHYIEEVRESGSPTMHFNQAHQIDEASNMHMYFDPTSNIAFVNGDILDFCRWYKECASNEHTHVSSSVIKQVFHDFENFEWAFSSPPWGGYSYNGVKNFNLENNISLNYKEMIIRLSTVANNIALFLPRNTNLSEFSGLLSILGFHAIEIEAIRDTRFNYILGIVFYAVRTRSKFKLRYLFGQDIDLIGDRITKKLIHFISVAIGASISDKSEHSDEKELAKSTIRILSKFGRKMEKWLKKRGLEPLASVTYLLNSIANKVDNCLDPSLIENLSNYFSVDGDTLVQIPIDSLSGNYSKYLRQAVEKLDKCYQFSGSE